MFIYCLFFTAAGASVATSRDRGILLASELCSLEIVMPNGRAWPVDRTDLRIVAYSVNPCIDTYGELVVQGITISNVEFILTISPFEADGRSVFRCSYAGLENHPFALYEVESDNPIYNPMLLHLAALADDLPEAKASGKPAIVRDYRDSFKYQVRIDPIISSYFCQILSTKAHRVWEIMHS